MEENTILFQGELIKLIIIGKLCLVDGGAGADLAVLSVRGLTGDWLLLERRNLGLDSGTLRDILSTQVTSLTSLTSLTSVTQTFPPLLCLGLISRDLRDLRNFQQI